MHRIRIAVLAAAVPALLCAQPQDQGHCRDASASLERKANIGFLPGDPFARLGVTAADAAPADRDRPVTFLGKTKFLNGARAVVTHSIDDSNHYVPQAIDAMEKYGIKATLFITTQAKGEGLDMAELWARVRKAVASGHEVGSHSRTHRCHWPDSPSFCTDVFSEDEVAGSRDDILKNTPQRYVWAWAYPCGNCGECAVAQDKIAAAGYLVARTYPGEEQNRHNVPDLQTYATNVYSAAYTQTVQKRGGIATTGQTDVPALNAKFDEVYRRGGIYSFVSHPQWLDYGPNAFYEKHLAHVGGRKDVWYAPLGPLYAYRTLAESTQVRELNPRGALARFAVASPLDPRVFETSITLEFRAPERVTVTAGGSPVPERADAPTDRWDGVYFRRAGGRLLLTVQPNTVLEFR